MRTLSISIGCLLLALQTLSGQQTGMLGGRGGGVFQTTYQSAAGNNIDPEFDNTSLPNIPRHWGGTSLGVLLGASPPTGAALRARTYLNNRTGYIQKFELYVASSSMACGDFASIAVGKGISPLDFFDPAVPIAYYVRLTNDCVAGALKLAISVPTDTGEQVFTWSGTVALQTAYTLYIEHSIVFGRTLFRVQNDTVMDWVHDSSAVDSIGTLVLGSSGGSTGRNILYLIDRVLETPLPAGGRLPTGVSVESPANGATNQEVSQTLVCSPGNDVDTWQVRYGTTNPITSDWVSLGTSRSLGPVTLTNSSTYYMQCRGSNENGTGSPSAVSSFSTIAASSTGTHPTLLITSGRQTIWAQMKGDYDASATNPKCTDVGYSVNQKIACTIYKTVVDQANEAIGSDLTNEGVEPALLSQVTGENASARCLTAYNTSVSTGVLHYSTSAAAAADLNVHRELFTDWVLVYDWCYQQWTQTQRDTYLSRLNGLATGILTTYYPNGWVCGDVDQPIGNYFGLAALYYSTKSYNQTIVDLWADDDIGGVTAGSLICSPSTSLSKTARNMIAYYYGEATGSSTTSGPSVGGAWWQGTEYSAEAFLGVLGCEAVRTTDAGNAPCTEIDTWIDDWAQYYTHRISRDYQSIYQFADNQEPHTQWMPFFNNHETAHYLTLTGLLPDGSIRQHLWRQFLNFFAVNGSGQTFPGLYASRTMMLANPYVTAASDLTALPQCYPSTGAGVYTWNDSWTGVSSNASQFVTHFKGDMRAHDHLIAYFGDIYLYRKGQFAVTHPFSYAGVAGLLPEGTNTVSLEGLDPSPGRLSFVGPQYKQANGYTCGSNYLYVAGTTGGGYRPGADYDGVAVFPPEHYVDEYTRSVVYLPSVSKTYDTIYVVDRASVKDPETLTRFNQYATGTCYPATATACFSLRSVGEAYKQRIQEFPRWSSYLFQWIDSSPSVASNVTTWTLADGQIVEDNWLTPDAVTITLEDTNNNFAFNNPNTTIPGERKWRTKIEPNTNVDWNVMARVITARDSGAAAPVTVELSVTGTCLATHIKRTGENDVVIISNAAQGDLIPQLYPTAAQAAAVLATARYHKAKTCTIPWTASTATTQVISLDQNPTGLTWTTNLDSAGAVSATPNSSGLKELSVSGTGAHSLVLVGS